MQNNTYISENQYFIGFYSSKIYKIRPKIKEKGEYSPFSCKSDVNNIFNANYIDIFIK